MRTRSELDDGAAASWRNDLALAPRQIGIPVAVAIVALTVFVVGIGLLIEREPAAGIGAADLDISEALVAQRAPTIDNITGVGAQLAGTITVAVLWVGSMVIATIVTRRATIALFLLAAIGGEKLTYLFATLIVARPRPPVDPIGTVFATSSFPSGHAAAAVSVYGALAIALLWSWEARHHRATGRAVRLAAACAVAVTVAFVGFSRLWRGHHYLSDVVAGALLGSVWLVIAQRVVLQRTQGRSAPIEPGSRAAGDHDRGRSTGSVATTSSADG